MADKKGSSLEAAEIDASQVKFLKSFAMLLKEHRELLTTLPEMFERFAEIDWNMPTTAESPSFRNTRRMSSLEKECEEKGVEIENLRESLSKKEDECKNYRDYGKSFDQIKSRDDELMKELDKKDEKIQTYCERIKQLETANKENSQLLTQTPIALEMENRISSLVKECEEKDRESQDLKDRNTTLQNELKEKTTEIEEAKKLNTTLENELKEKTTEIEERKKMLAHEKDNCQKAISGKDAEINKMRSRLAYLSEKQVKKDQRNVEDTTSPNRPSEVEKDFAAFIDDDRVDACDKMQEKFGSEEEIDVGIHYPRLACMIFEAAYEETNETKAKMTDLFKNMSQNMIISAPSMAEEYCSKKQSGELQYQLPFKVTISGQESANPTEVLDALTLFLKDTAHICNLQTLEQGVRNRVREKWLKWISDESFCTLSHSDSMLVDLNDYIMECIRLTWRIVTQVPPMQLEYQSSLLAGIHKKLGYHSSPEMRSVMHPSDAPTQEEIACYLWPGLLDGGGRLIRAGEVLCKVQEFDDKLI